MIETTSAPVESVVEMLLADIVSRVENELMQSVSDVIEGTNGSVIEPIEPANQTAESRTGEKKTLSEAGTGEEMINGTDESVIEPVKESSKQKSKSGKRTQSQATQKSPIHGQEKKRRLEERTEDTESMDRKGRALSEEKGRRW